MHLFYWRTPLCLLICFPNYSFHFSDALYFNVFLDIPNIKRKMEILCTSFFLMHLSKFNDYEELTEKTFTQPKIHVLAQNTLLNLTL